MEPLKDPLNDRPMTGLIPPPSRALLTSLLFPNNTNIPDWRILRDHLQKEGRISKASCLQIITQTSQLLSMEENLLDLMDPITIVGDIHGQYYDLLKILELSGDLLESKILFLGDLVDRGSFSVEIILLLYALKINFPRSVFLLRGNHESRQLTTQLNFRTECLDKYDLEVYTVIMESFDNLPLACIVNKKFLAVHGGISPELHLLSDIRKINRKVEPPREGIFCDLLWADPAKFEVPATQEEFVHNETRGCSYHFGVQAVNKFLLKNKLLSIIRAHEAQPDGYKMHNCNGSSTFPVVITVFSAPNYCDVYNNKGAILKFANNSMQIQQYDYTVHPFVLQNFSDGLSWSAPFVIEKIMAIMHEVTKRVGNIAQNKEEGMRIKELEEEIKANKIRKIRNKVRFVGRMLTMFKTLRSDKEERQQLKGMCPDNKITKGLLQSKEYIEGTNEAFLRAKEHNTINENR